MPIPCHAPQMCNWLSFKVSFFLLPYRYDTEKYPYNTRNPTYGGMYLHTFHTPFHI